MMDLQNEKQLIERARKDPEAFGELFEQYYSPILHYVLRRVANVHIAEDITSEIFFLVYRKLWQFKWRNIPFSAWLYRIAGNEISYYFRKQKAKIVSLETLLEEKKWEPVDAQLVEEELKEAEAEVEKHHQFLFMQKKLLQLPLQYQEVLTLKYFEQKKIHEIGLILGKNENTVKSLLKRGLKLLQQEFAREKLLQQFSTSNLSEYEQL